MYIFTWKIARIHTSYTESLASCSYIYIYIHIWIILDNYGWLVVLTIFKHISQWEGWHPIYEMENTNHVPNHQSDGYIWAIHGSLNVPIFHITQPWMVFLVFFMAIFSGDVQYTKMGQLPTLHMGYIWAISPVIRRSGASTSRVTSSPAVSGAGTSTAAGRDGLGPRERRCLALVTVRYRGIWTTGTSDLGQIYHNKHEKICRAHSLSKYITIEWGYIQNIWARIL